MIFFVLLPLKNIKTSTRCAMGVQLWQYSYIYMCRYITCTCKRRRERDVCLISSLFQRGVGVDVVCVCVYAHTHTLHVGYSDLRQGRQGVGTRKEDCKSPPHTPMPYMSTIYTTKLSLFCSKKKKICTRNIETSNPAGFEQIDPTERVLDYLCA